MQELFPAHQIAKTMFSYELQAIDANLISSSLIRYFNVLHRTSEYSQAEELHTGTKPAYTKLVHRIEVHQTVTKPAFLTKSELPKVATKSKLLRMIIKPAKQTKVSIQIYFVLRLIGL